MWKEKLATNALASSHLLASVSPVLMQDKEKNKNFLTRWQQVRLMAPIEGLLFHFQIFCIATSGYFQFKHVALNEWNYSEGNVILPDSSEGAGTTLKRSMDVEEHDMLVERVTTTWFFQHHELPLEGIQNISVADVDTSRHHIDDFLTSHTVYEILPNSGKVVVLDLSMPIKRAFHLLHEQGIPLAPLWDSNRQQFVGMLTPSDFISIIMQIGDQRAILSEEELESHTIAAWKVEKSRLAETMQRRRVPFQYAGPDDLLKDVVKKLLYHHVTTIPVLYSTEEEREMPQILHLATLCGILNYLCRYFDHSLGMVPLLKQAIGSLPLGTWRGDMSNGRLLVLAANMSFSTALKLLDQAGVSSIPIIDESGSLLDVYARSDITALAKDSLYAHVQLDQLSVKQALQLVHNRDFQAGGALVRRCQMCVRTDSLQSVMERLSIPGVRRIVCVEAGSRRVEGIITLSDVFNFLLL
ncbi:hypothetical protein GOP47_0009339 [Adiantum capillus-veneris]|uniref:CBS domain-containing protein n=1 Tax=Adiantum capillus-veneris TaxID=13818 RepID=A0A9D4ZH39_ADICA|nr:hypothetical protein GOP47_0009339 [Adiantum capillus-veneris]